MEDNVGDAELVIEYLRDADAPGVATTLRHVERLAAALDVLAHDRPDVILLDLQLPDADGLEAVRAIVPVAAGTPIVVLTGMAREATALEAVRQGAQDYLLKGQFNGDALMRAMRYAIERERLQRAVRSNEEIIRTALVAAPIGMALTDLDGRWRVVNRALCEFTGYTEAELLQRTFRDITFPDDLAADVAHMQRLLAGEAPSYEMEKRYVRKDGAIVWARLSRSLVRDERGRPRHFIAQIESIDERRRAMESRAQLLAVSDALVAANTPDDVARHAATQLAVALGASATLLAAARPDGRELEMLGDLPLDDALASTWRRIPLDAGLPLVDAFRTRHPLWLESADEIAARYPMLARRTRADVGAVAALPLARADQVIGAMAITYAGRARRFTPGDRDVLLAVARQCTLALDRALLFEAERETSARARAASEAKSRFLAVMSHELRTPLASIIGFAELVADGSAGPVTDRQRDYQARIRTSAEQLLVMIDDILTLSRVEAGREPVQTEPVVVGAFVRDVLALFTPAAHAKGLALTLDLRDETLRLQTDPTKLRQILVNVLGNAVKFTDTRDGRQGRVGVHVVDAGSVVEIRIVDTGVGIAHEHVERIFEPFWQAGQSRRGQGTGLGLDVSLRLARLLGGDLRVESTLGEGSTFTLRLPATAAAPRDDGADPDTPGAQADDRADAGRSGSPSPAPSRQAGAPE